MENKRKILDVSKIKLIQKGFTMTGFIMIRMIASYLAFIELKGVYPEVIKMTERQYRVYENHLEDFAKAMGIIIYKHNKNLTFRGTPIEIIKDEQKTRTSNK